MRHEAVRIQEEEKVVIRQFDYLSLGWGVLRNVHEHLE
jgi:hypothetical protein